MQNSIGGVNIHSMSDGMFEVDDRELKAMKRDFSTLKLSQIKAVEREVVNDQAFAARSRSINKEIPGMFHNRSKWVVSSILVDKAKKGDKKIQSEYGAKKRWRRNPADDFMGMALQELGGTERKPAIEAAAARSGGKFAGRVLPSAKLQKLEPLEDSRSFGSGRNGVIAMLRILDRQNFKGGMKISSTYPGFKKGIYRFKGARFKLASGLRVRPIQMVLDLSKRSARIRKKPWMKTSVKQSVTKTFTNASFVKQFKRFTAPRRSR